FSIALEYPAAAGHGLEARRRELREAVKAPVQAHCHPRLARMSGRLGALKCSSPAFIGEPALRLQEVKKRLPSSRWSAKSAGIRDDLAKQDGRGRCSFKRPLIRKSRLLKPKRSAHSQSQTVHTDNTKSKAAPARLTQISRRPERAPPKPRNAQPRYATDKNATDPNTRPNRQQAFTKMRPE
ncbi:MAG: hypothetical protein AAF074_23160, partial [Pseudomonadota bacterium]